MKNFLLYCLKVVAMVYMLVVLVIAIGIDLLLLFILGPTNTIHEWFDKEEKGILTMMAKLANVHDEFNQES